MAYYAHPDVLDGGLNFIDANCDQLVVVSAYTLGDSYATVQANALASVAMAPADFTLGNSGSNRTLTSASGKQDASADASGVASHFAFVDTINSKVLWVTQENTGQSITAGNPVDFPSLVYTSKQPVLTV